MNKFYVLLAGDNAGKSTVLNYFLERQDWQVASYDAVNVPEEYRIIRDIDDSMETHTLKYFPQFSTEFKSSLYAPYIYYLRDQVQEKLKTGNVLCNSYYYKILAKDFLQGGDNPSFHNEWRKLPKPDRILFLDTPPEVAASRIEDIFSLFSNEYEGEVPSVTGFVSFQHKLRDRMRYEIKDIPTVFLPGDKSVAEILTALEQALQE